MIEYPLQAAVNSDLFDTEMIALRLNNLSNLEPDNLGILTGACINIDGGQSKSLI